MSCNFITNELVMKFTAHELQRIRQFNRFVVSIYLQSWFISRVVVDAPYDIQLTQRLDAYDNDALQTVGLNMMVRHSWYLNPELATLSLFSQYLFCQEKAQLVPAIRDNRGLYLLKTLPHAVQELSISRSISKPSPEFQCHNDKG